MSRFVGALKELDPDADQESLRRRLPVRLSDFAHVDFSRSSNKWRVRKPVLAGLIGSPREAILCGARSESLVEALQKAAQANKSEFAIREELSAPSS